jgi:predicted dehydrogenase
MADEALFQPVRWGMIGGGLDAFIGSVHRRAATMDGELALVSGCLARDPEIANRSGAAYGLDPGRVYTSVDAMLDGEGTLPPEQRVELISIVTPNFTHHEIAKACLERGFHVLIEKPMTTTSQQAAELESLARDRGSHCFVMYNYTGYPMVRQARDLVAAGEIGTVRKAFVEYLQGWLSRKEETSGNQQAEWRTDPTRAGVGGALGDIGSHAENMLRFVTGLETESLCAELASFVEGRVLDDDASVLLRMAHGARGVLTASQVCAGEGNGLVLRIYGDRGGLRWRQEDPEALELLSLDGATKTIRRGGPESGPHAAQLGRVPLGHPEGFIEAFANIYRGAAELVAAARTGREPASFAALTPTAEHGRRGVRFIERCVESAKAGGVWTPVGE